jgi:hypothetical protein
MHKTASRYTGSTVFVEPMSSLQELKILKDGMTDGLSLNVLYFIPISDMFHKRASRIPESYKQPNGRRDCAYDV